MSYENFKKAMLLAPKCEFCSITGGKVQAEILKSEELLGVKFSKQCREFYEKYGHMSFDGNEIYGIYPNRDPKKGWRFFCVCTL